MSYQTAACPGALSHPKLYDDLFCFLPPCQHPSKDTVCMPGNKYLTGTQAVFVNSCCMLAESIFTHT